jgi:hypothetical protein
LLTIYDWIYGIAQISAVVLVIIAGFIAVSLFSSVKKSKYLHSWKWMIGAMILFAVVEIIGILKTFGIFRTPFLTHILPGVILAFVIVAVVIQININRGWLV